MINFYDISVSVVDFKSSINPNKNKLLNITNHTLNETNEIVK